MCKIIKIFIAFLSIISLANCNVDNYIFNDITNHEIEEVKLVTYSYSIYMSAEFKYKGDYSKFIDTNYKYLGNGSIALEKYENAMSNAKFILRVSFDVFDSISSVVPLTYVFFVSNNKIYTGNDSSGVYVSTNYVSLYNIKEEADKELK